MTRIHLILPLALAALSACTDDPTPAAPTPDIAADVAEGADGDATAPDAEADASAPDGTGDTSSNDVAAADAAVTDTVADPPLGGPECRTTTEGTAGQATITRHELVPSCIDPRTSGLPQKPHLVMVNASGTPNGLWVHMPGSGGTPPNTTNILRAAAAEGYIAVGLAYMNEPSTGSACEGQPLGCHEEVRSERIWGLDNSGQVDVAAADSIVFRLTRLLEYLHAEFPDAGWGTYLDGDEPAWDQISLSGFSQGGGMAGMIARDRLIKRAMHLSSAADGGSNAFNDPASAPVCDGQTPCTKGICCPPGSLFCDPPAASGTCTWRVPVLWATTGADIDGDGFGDGDVSTRATPGDRHFALVHRDENAIVVTPQVLELWGTPNLTPTDADAGSPPYGGSRLLTTGLPPNGNCSEHQSVGNDFCQPKDANGRPRMLDAWRYMMSALTTP